MLTSLMRPFALMCNTLSEPVFKLNCVALPSTSVLIFSALKLDSVKLSMPLILFNSGKPTSALAKIVPLLILYAPLYLAASKCCIGIFNSKFNLPLPAVFRSSVKPCVTNFTGLSFTNLMPSVADPSTSLVIFSIGDSASSCGISVLLVMILLPRTWPLLAFSSMRLPSNSRSKAKPSITGQPVPYSSKASLILAVTLKSPNF